MTGAQEATDTSVTKVSSNFAPSGQSGQRYLAAGRKMSMRLWSEEPPGEVKPESTRPYETIGFVIKGRAELYLGEQLVLLEAGDSYVVPKDAKHRYKILDTFTAVEATSPPAEIHGRDSAEEG
ncbi:MAG: cupin domain-containing protein [Blastocatellia bacterium AA13]|nr:MAG: cupin domain-containing protein [Blastocatellia bacterium AA13]